MGEDVTSFSRLKYAIEDRWRTDRTVSDNIEHCRDLIEEYVGAFNVTLLDTVTQTKTTVKSKHRAFWWAEGNGSCDCNRAKYFAGVDKLLDAVMRVAHPELEPHQSYCYGCTRILIINAPTDEYPLAEFNADYPPELVHRYLNAENMRAIKERE